MNSRQCNFQRLIPALIFIAGTIFISGKLLPELPLFITDNGNKYMVMRNFAEHGSLAMAHELPLLFPKGGFHFQSLGNGEIHSFHSVVLPVMSAPFYLIFGKYGALLPVWLAGLGIVLLMINGDKRVRFALWGLLLTTPFWLYSVMLWEMIPSMLAALGGFMLLKRQKFLLSGIVFALGIWMREELYILGFIVGVHLLCQRRWRDSLQLAAGAVAAIVPLWLINYALYGHILGLHGATYAMNNRTGGFSLTDELSGIVFNYYQHLLRFETLPAAVSLTISIVGAAALIVPGFFKNAKLKLAGVAVFALIDAIFIWNLFKSPSPLFSCGVTMSLLFSLPLAAGYFINLRQLLTDRNHHYRQMAQITAIYIITVPPLLTRFDIGLTFGARHYMCIMPLLMLLSFRGFAKMQCGIKSKQLFLIVLTVMGIALQFYGFKTLYLSSHASDRFEKAIQSHPAKVVISDVFFLPEQTPEIYFDKLCLEVISPEQATAALDHLEKNQITEFILILGQNNNFRRMDNAVLKILLEKYPLCAAPAALDAAPGMPLFIAHCRKAIPSTVR